MLRLPRAHPVVRGAWELEKVGVQWYEPISGIYGILDTVEPDIYIGETSHFYQRKMRHDLLLRRQTHPNCLFRDACPDGIDNRRWRFLVLEELHQGKSHRLEREHWWHRHLPSCINVLNAQMTRDFRALAGW
jgi:hypothetical protein